MEAACLRFVREHSEILSFKLRNNFLCHLATLYDSGVLQTKHVKTVIDALPKKSGTAAAAAMKSGRMLANSHQPATQTLQRVKSEHVK